jgi:1-phosphofructokinase family hexose kinase
MGADATLVTIAGGPTGRAALEMLESEGIETVSTPCDGDTRTSLTVLTPGQTTVFNGSGPHITREEWEAFEDTFDSMLSQGTVAACSGSLPPGTPADAVARLVKLSADAGAFLVVDSSREQLAGAMEAGASLVTPNLAEARAIIEPGGEEAVQETKEALSSAAAAASELVARGAESALVTVGSQGAVLATSEKTITFRAPHVEVVNPIGAGDSLVAGVLLGAARDDSLDRGTALGIAMASASCETFYAGALERRRVEILLQPPI